MTIDWTLLESARAKIKVLVKRILHKHGYPPDLQDSPVASHGTDRSRSGSRHRGLDDKCSLDTFPAHFPAIGKYSLLDENLVGNLHRLDVSPRRQTCCEFPALVREVRGSRGFHRDSPFRFVRSLGKIDSHEACLAVRGGASLLRR